MAKIPNYTTIVLTGGYGTRLSELVPDRPKILAPIGDKPFLTYFLEWFSRSSGDPSQLILATGYMHDKILDYTQKNALSLEISFESIPVGTLGAILNACQMINNDHILIRDTVRKFADENGLVVNDYKISNLKQNDIFSEGLVKQIFLTRNGDINLLTNNTLTKSFLISTKETEYKKLDKNGNEFEQYEAKARLNLINKIYQSYDENANQKYKVEVNQRTIDRVKNSF